MRDNLWKLLVDIKIAEYYFLFYSQRASKKRTIVSGLCALASASFVYTWYQTGILPLLWSILICLAQVVSILQPYFPYEKQLTAARYLHVDLSVLSFEIENIWYCSSKLNEDEMYNYFVKFREAQMKIENRFSTPDTFSLNKRIHSKAEQNAKIYLQNHFY